MRLDLNGDWTLYYAPERAGKPDEYAPGMEDGWENVPAAVPGNVELDLMRAGVAPDPFYGLNLYAYAKYESYQWLYARDVRVPEDFPGDRVILRFEGIDTIADVYLGGAHVGRAENMLIAHEFDVTHLAPRGQTLRLCVHIHSAMNFARGKRYTVAMRGTGHRNEICWLRKAPHSFGWDIAPRLVSAGLWRDVSLAPRNNTRILEAYYATPQLEDGGIWLQYAYRFETDADELEGFRVRVTAECGDSRFEHDLPAHFVSANHALFIPAPRLWWPNGYGEQPLYAVRMQLIHRGAVVDEREEKIGLRTFRLERSFERGDQQFLMSVNDVPIFVRGTNWVPLDALHSRDLARLERVHALCAESGVNMIRCWGGNVYEHDALFDLCDESGILVWQDFAMGNTNYPQTDEFVPALEEEMGAFLRRARNHPSLAIWSSDNEVDLKNMGYMYPHYDSRVNRVAQETLRRILQAHDPYRFYLCSSPEIPNGFNPDDVPEQHTWGARAWFKDDFYKHSSARFIGEAGYHGCPAPESLARFIPANKLWPFDNDVWAAHSTEDIRIEPVLNGRNHLMANQVKLMFGEIPDDLRRFSALSQISQAEAMKFFVERTRALKWRRTGIIWWNMIDCWPQISDAVVDYYFVKKRAFHYLRRAQLPVLLFFGEISHWTHDVLATNDTREDARFSYAVEEADGGEIVLRGEAVIPAGGSARLGQLTVIGSEQKLYLIRWRLNGRAYANHYITGYPPYRAEEVLRWAAVVDRLPCGEPI